MANWQTTTANLFARLTIKPLVKRHVSIETLRSSIAAIERLFAGHPAGCEIAHDQPLPGRIVIGGLSARGGMALGILLAIRDRRWPLPAGAIVMSPLTDLTDPHDGPRLRNAPRDPALCHARGVAVRDMYVGGEPKLMKHAYASPVFGDYARVPPVLFQVGSTEILLNEGLALARAKLDSVWNAGSPLAAARALPVVGRCSIDFAARRFMHPARVTPELGSRLAHPQLPAWTTRRGHAPTDRGLTRERRAPNV